MWDYLSGVFWAVLSCGTVLAFAAIKEQGNSGRELIGGNGKSLRDVEQRSDFEGLCCAAKGYLGDLEGRNMAS
jgi:hypothetical protein